MALGLSVADVVAVQVNVAPTAAPFLGFGNALILGSSPVVDINERYRLYSGGDTALAAIATDFGTTSPEYQAAALFFEQEPQPQQVYVGRWAQTDTPGLLHGATLSAAQSQLSNFTGITNGSMAVTIDGVLRTLSGLNFSSALNLNGVAGVIDAALPAAVIVNWNPVYKRFNIISGTTGTNSSVSFASATNSGTDVSSLLGLQSTSGGSIVAGIAAETLLACVSSLADKTNLWYALTVATATPPSLFDHLAVAGFIEGTNARRYGVTIQNSSVLDATQTGDLASQLKALGYRRTDIQYSSSSPYAVASYIGRYVTVDFTAQNSTMTMKFKQEPGVVAETLPESQAATLTAKNCNVYVNYANGVAIIQQGTAASGVFSDEVQNLDWLANAVQTNIFNVLYQAETKVPQTDAGVALLKNAAAQACAAGVNNGMIAEGQWTGPSFGSLKQNTVLPGGYYIYAPPVANQAQADREARKAPTMQIAVKLSGAVHSSNVIISVNR